MPQNSGSPNNRFKLIAAFLTVGIISLLQPGCNCSSSNGGTAPPSAVTSVLPLSNSVTALVSTDVSAVFLNDMDDTSVINGFTLTLNNTPVAAAVSYDSATKTARLTTLSDLASSNEYRATIASSVKDVNGDSPLSTDLVWSFTISPSMLLVSKNANGVTSNDYSGNTDIDATGRYIVFESEASNLTSIATTLNQQHIYRKDAVTGEVLLVSSDASGLVEANNLASNPSISSNGRYVVFESAADNLDGDSNGNKQIYLKDLDTSAVSLISRNASGIPDNGAGGASNAKVSGDGRYVLFQSSDSQMSAIAGGGFAHIYLKDMSNGTIQMISRFSSSEAGNGNSSNPDMSADGTHIVFESLATNFTTSVNGQDNIYYVDTSVVHTVEQISLSSDNTEEANAGSNNPSISDDGLVVVFDSFATNLDSFDGNGVRDVFFRYRPLIFTKLVSFNAGASNSGNGTSTNASISSDGNYVAFESRASDLASGGALGKPGIFVRDLSALPDTVIDLLINTPESGSVSTLDSNSPVISNDGRYVSFHTTEKMTLDDTDTLFDVFRVHNSTHP